MRMSQEQYQAYLNKHQQKPAEKQIKPGPTQPKDKRNGLEREYGKLLEEMKRNGEIVDYFFEGMTLKLADDCRYTPDYLVVYPDHFECHETKGFWREDARIKIKVAAKSYPYFIFKAIRLEKSEWKIEEFSK